MFHSVVQSADSCETILVGDDNIFLCYSVFMSKMILVTALSSQRCGQELRRIHDGRPSNMCEICWEEISQHMLFAHGILGCSCHFKTQAQIFLDENATQDDIVSEVEAALVCLCKGTAGDTLAKMRLQRFHETVATSMSFVQPESLPPTSSADK